MTTALFYIFATLLLGSSLLVVLNRNPMYSVIALVFAFINLAGIYFLLEAYFIGVLQVLVYAGAIMVLFLFVVMLLNVEPDRPRLRFVSFQRWWFALLAGIFLVTITLLIGRGIGRLSLAGSDVEPGFGDVEQVAQVLFTRYLLPFETAGLLLTVALIGTVFLAKRKI